MGKSHFHDALQYRRSSSAALVVDDVCPPEDQQSLFNIFSETYEQFNLQLGHSVVKGR